MEVRMLTKGRVSLIIAAGGLLLVGLLAAALFAPSGEETEKAPVAKKNEKPMKMEVINPPKSLPAQMGAPTLTPPSEPAKPVDQPKAEQPKETKPAIVDYKIQSGDMLSKIAKKYGCKVEDIYKLNEGLNAQTANKIRVGQVIRVPNGPGAVVETTAPEKAEAKGFARRVVKAEAGDTAFSLAIEYYGARALFRLIMEANPDLPWSDRLKGGEEVVLPQWGEVEAAPEPAKGTSTEKPKETVERDGLIPARR
jgi:LysM repeat protein